MEPEGSLPCSQKLHTGPYIHSDESSTYFISLFLKDSFYYYPAIHACASRRLFHSGFPANIL
jgi:hypothetical protein